MLVLSSAVITTVYAGCPCKPPTKKNCTPKQMAMNTCQPKKEMCLPCKPMKCQPCEKPCPESKKVVSIKERKERLVQKRKEQALMAERQAEERMQMMASKKMEMDKKREMQKQAKMKTVEESKNMKMAKVKPEKDCTSSEPVQSCRKKLREICRDRASQMLKKMDPEKVAALKKECAKMKSPSKEIS